MSGLRMVQRYHPRNGTKEMKVRSVYLAARFSRQAEMRKYRDLLEKSRIWVTATWLDQKGDGELGDHPDQDTKHAVMDLEDVRVADGLVFFSERNLARRGGRHVEFGYALALGKQVYVVGNRENIFHYTPGVRHFATIEDVIQELKKGNQ